MANPDGGYCIGCPLQRLGTGFALRGGRGDLGVLAVAEALGEKEAAKGEPLVGPAGRVFDRILSRTEDPYRKRKLSRDDFLLANCVSCRPPNNHLSGAPYENAAIDRCRHYLEDTIRDFSPRVILTLGNIPLRWFTGNWGIEKLRGYVFETEWGPVVPTYHPSYIMRGNFHLARVVETDILKALKIAEEGTSILHREKRYELHPNIETASAFYAEWTAAGCPDLAFDIETPYASGSNKDEAMTFEEDESYQINMVSFSWKGYHAITMPFIPPYIQIIKEIFAKRARFLVWNAKFDVPRLVANDVSFGGPVVDVMLMWHWLEPQLPMGLKYVATFLCPDMSAWKLAEKENMQWYSCADSDVLLRSYEEIKTRLEDQGRWDIFKRHFLEYGEVLQKMTERGVLVDLESRTRSRERFEAKLQETQLLAQEKAPSEACKVHPRKGYKKTAEQLKNSGLWAEGSMQEIMVEVDDAEYEKELKRRERASKPKAKSVRKTSRKRRATSTQLSLLREHGGDVSTDTDGGTK